MKVLLECEVTESPWD